MAASEPDGLFRQAASPLRVGWCCRRDFTRRCSRTTWTTPATWPSHQAACSSDPRRAGRVYAVVDADGGGACDRDRQRPRAQTRDGDGTWQRRQLRFDDMEQPAHRDGPRQYEPGAFVEVPSPSVPDDYMSVGSTCNVCLPATMYACVNPNRLETGVLRGRRAQQRQDFQLAPMHELWFTDERHDMLGDNMPTSSTSRPTSSCCPQGDVPDPEFGAQRACSTTRASRPDGTHAHDLLHGRHVPGQRGNVRQARVMQYQHRGSCCGRSPRRTERAT